MAWNHTMLRFLKGDDGQGMAEYAFLLALIAMVVMAAISTLGNTITQSYNNIQSKLQ